VIVVATVVLASVGAASLAEPAAAATTTHGYTWSGSCAYRWSNGWVKQGCLMRMGGRRYFHSAISRAWYLHLASGTWYVRLYPTGWMTGEEYYRAWGYYNTINASLYRQMCMKAFGKLC
jgi:hypothetical protein